MAISRAISPPRSWHLLRNKKPRFIIAATNKDLRWSGIISWVLPYCLEERSRKQERISIRPPRRDENAGHVWRITILPSIVRWQRDFARTRGCQSCSFDQKLCGCSAIRTLRSRTSTKRSSMRARAATQFPCYGHSLAHSFSSIATAEITRNWFVGANVSHLLPGGLRAAEVGQAWTVARPLGKRQNCAVDHIRLAK
jgi:hypothetical protein